MMVQTDCYRKVYYLCIMPSENLIINILLSKKYEKSWIGNGDLLNDI